VHVCLGFTSIFTMRVAALLPFLSLAAAAIAAPHNDPSTSPRRDLGTIGSLDSSALLPRDGCEKNGCKCRKGLKPGVYCGSCTDGHWLITRKRVEMYAYWCNDDGACCTFGNREDCNQWGAKCPDKG
jgi:hypothetical protein